MTASATRARPFGVYIHVPYCRKLCPYCDFVKKAAKGAAPHSFTDALCSEIAAFEGPREIQSVFFGGGTPSLLETDDLNRIFDAIQNRFQYQDMEVSFEINPDDVTADRAIAWKQAGINRVSIGVQSFDDAVLQYLGRLHDAQTAIEACHIVRDTFENWNIDLIFGAHPVSAWRDTLERTVSLAPPHVSTYGLTFEPKTPFAKRTAEAVSDDVYVDLYAEAHAALRDFDHYEVSNYARPGFESNHNLLYWHNLEYAGFGPGAYSFLDGVRSRNRPGVNEYIDFPGEKVEALHLDAREIRTETLIQHFRLRKGLEKRSYERRFGTTVHDDFRDRLGLLLKRGLLEESDTHLRPTLRGFELNNEIGLALVD